MDDTYPYPPPPKHRRPFPSPPPPSNSDDEGNYLISPSSEEEVQPVKRQIVDRSAQGFKFVPRTGTGSNPPDNVKIPADWSKDSTFALIQAWGDRFLLNGKGKLNSDHWAQIARDVNAVCERRYSVLQCQNRVETLKKMYKKQRSGALEPSSSSSNWFYFEKMDELMGEREPQLDRRQEREMPRLRTGRDTGEYVNGEVPCDNGSEEAAEEEGDDKNDDDYGNGGSKFRALAESVKGVEEVFERVESSRKERVKELERVRSEFLKELEAKQREIFERAQAEIAMIGEESDNDDDNDDDINGDNDDNGDDEGGNLSD